METKKKLLSIICLLACVISVHAQTLYGLTNFGGNDGWGALIKFIPATNNLTVAKSFESFPCVPLYTNFIQASDGKLYGMTKYGGNHITGGGVSSGGGLIFSFDPSSSTYTKLKDFDGTNGANPLGSLMQASNGKLYGMTNQGGSNNAGVIFSFDPSTSIYTKLKDFDFTNGAYPDGANPSGSLMQASDGKLYGMTYAGGIGGNGVIFSFDPSSSTFTKLKDFDFTNGAYPNGSLMQASDGKLYGMTAGGGSGNGVIFSFDPSTSIYTKLKNFDYTNGANPKGILMQASDGKLYGMTAAGGTGGNGVIFSFNPSTSTYTKMKDFDYTDGDIPFGSLTQAIDGKLYGMTSRGGSSDLGVIFSFDPASSAYIKLKDFDNANGREPHGSMMQASNGKLYGMTSVGGNSGMGVIFSFDPSAATYTKLKDFAATNGQSPSASLMQASNGKFYGVTTGGGSSGDGVIFSFDPSTSIYTKLKDFDRPNGAHPSGSLMQASDGKLYGMTYEGGSTFINNGYGYGVIFSFDPSTSTYAKLVDFATANANGSNPYGSLMQASDGKLYGMTSGGGNITSQNQGIIFSFDPSTSTFSNLKDFDVTDGNQPWGSLMQASDGKLYGMAGGGSNGAGVIFSFDPSTSIYTKLKDFDYTNGANPNGSLMQASDGKLYGMTVEGGGSGYGVIFSFDPNTSIYTKLKDFNGTNGAKPYGNLKQASDGKLYGMTSDGGSGGVNNYYGVIFSFDPSTSTYTKLQDFDITNGAYPSLGSAFIEVSNIASVAINITAGVNPTCNGESVTFTATPVNGGSSPTYQWKVNGNNVGTNSPTYTTSTLTSGEVVSCVMTSSGNSATATSNSITMNVNSAVTPSATIAITSGTNPTCDAQSITFTAAPTNGGSSPAFQWKVNGSNVGTNNPTYTTNSLTNGQVISCVVTSSLSCASPTTAISNSITMSVSGVIVPFVNIAISSGTNPTCSGQSITFTATSTNGGSTPSYQWKVNGNNAGTISSTFTTNNLTNGQIVSCVITSNAACASPTTASSNSITMNVSSAVTSSVAVAITSGVNPTCTGQSLTFTATPTNGGTSPTYQWKVNGINAGTNSSTFTTNSLTNGQVVSCVMTSNATCANTTTAPSNNITIVITPPAVPAITITQTSCTGTTVGFTASITNGGTAPSYLWTFTGTGTATNFAGPNFILNNAANGAQVQCRLTSNAACVNPVQVISLPLIINCINNCTSVSPANLNFRVHPNPARQNAVVSFTLCASIRISIDVFNIAGQQITILEDRVLNSGNQLLQLNTDKLAAGVYFIRLQTMNYSTAKKLVVIH